MILEGAIIPAFRTALEQAGVQIIAENGGGAGVRLRFNRPELRAISRWEGEGGSVRQDAIFQVV